MKWWYKGKKERKSPIDRRTRERETERRERREREMSMEETRRVDQELASFSHLVRQRLRIQRLVNESADHNTKDSFRVTRDQMNVCQTNRKERKKEKEKRRTPGR